MGSVMSAISSETSVGSSVLVLFASIFWRPPISRGRFEHPGGSRTGQSPERRRSIGYSSYGLPEDLIQFFDLEGFGNDAREAVVTELGHYRVIGIPLETIPFDLRVYVYKFSYRLLSSIPPGMVRSRITTSKGRLDF